MSFNEHNEFLKLVFITDLKDTFKDAYIKSKQHFTVKSLKSSERKSAWKIYGNWQDMTKNKVHQFDIAV